MKQNGIRVDGERTHQKMIGKAIAHPLSPDKVDTTEVPALVAKGKGEVVSPKKENPPP